MAFFFLGVESERKDQLKLWLPCQMPPQPPYGQKIKDPFFDHRVSRKTEGLNLQKILRSKTVISSKTPQSDQPESGEVEAPVLVRGTVPPSLLQDPWRRFKPLPGFASSSLGFTVLCPVA